MAFILGVHFLREKKKKDDSLQLNFFSGPVDFNKVFSHWVVEMESLSCWNRGANVALSKIQIVENLISRKHN